MIMKKKEKIFLDIVNDKCPITFVKTKIALEKLGHSVEIISKPINKRQKFSFEIDWDRFESRDVTVDQIPIQVYEEERGKDEESGLEITIKRLRSEWDIDKIEELKEELKKILLPKNL